MIFKPCPVCGNHTKRIALLSHPETSVTKIMCTHCGYDDGEHPTPRAAVDAWNEKLRVPTIFPIRIQ